MHLLQNSSPLREILTVVVLSNFMGANGGLNAARCVIWEHTNFSTFFHKIRQNWPQIDWHFIWIAYNSRGNNVLLLVYIPPFGSFLFLFLFRFRSVGIRTEWRLWWNFPKPTPTRDQNSILLRLYIFPFHFIDEQRTTKKKKQSYRTLQVLSSTNSNLQFQRG